jgi:hypothetical protein
MGALDSIIKKLKNVKWEESSQTEVEAFRLSIAAFKAFNSWAPPIMREFLRKELVSHAKDKLAMRLFNHYLYSWGGDYTLKHTDMQHMMGNTCSFGHINLQAISASSPGPKPEWGSACSRAKSSGNPQEYSGSLLWAWDNGAIANYTVRYNGKVHNAGGACLWRGTVNYFDRFDLDPRWGWSPSNPQGRSRGGERRTRIGYMLDLGWDFDIVSPRAKATQGEFDAELTLGAPPAGSGSGGGSGDI